MANRMYRIGIVGASSLAGKELGDELQESSLAASEVVLLDEDEEAAGQLTVAGDEAAFIQKLDASSFEKMDFVFFAGDAEVTRRHWKQARRSQASIVDLTYALGGEKDVLVRAPLVGGADSVVGAGRGVHVPDLNTPAVVAAHPVAVMLAMVAGRLQAKLPLRQIAATVMEPASEHGRAAMDELHQQTVNLLAFKTLPKEQFDAQVSFNLVPALGNEAKVKLAEVGDRIRQHYRILAGEGSPVLALQMVQAPVFHGYAVSVFVELEQPATVEQLHKAMAGGLIEVVDGEAEPPSNVSAAGQSNVMVQVNSVEGERSSRFWLWIVADNLKLAALNAISCAEELRRLRPEGKVQ